MLSSVASQQSNGDTWSEIFPVTEGLRDLVQRINAAGGSYHELPLSEDLIVKGHYNMRQYLSFYGLPRDLSGKSVLDIGTASGFFAFECARRGANVIASDIWENPLLLELIPFCKASVRYVRVSVYELPEDLGRFDVIICGSLLLHLSDPLAALQRIHRLCVGRAIVSTGCTNDSETNSRPICEFVGKKATAGNYWTYWSLSAEALRRMLLAAGFVRVENEKHFTLQMQESPGDFWTIPHVVMTAVTN